MEKQGFTQGNKYISIHFYIQYISSQHGQHGHHNLLYDIVIGLQLYLT